MGKYKGIAFLTFFSFISAGLICQGASAQETWRERIREKVRERRSQRVEARREKRDARRNSAPSGENGGIVGPGDYDFSLLHEGLTRTYKLHVPAAYQRTVPASLVLAFHGGGGNSAMMADDASYNLISKSEDEGFIVAFPNGASRLKTGNMATWNAGNCCGYARDNNVDDVGFVRAVLSDLRSKLSIDPQEVYAVGMSNGGMFSYRLACEMTDELNAVASVAGTENVKECSPQRPLSVLHIHASDDDHVLFNGGAGAAAFRDVTKVTDFTSVPETIVRWVERNHCNPQPIRVLEQEGVYCDAYTGCADGVSVKLCVTATGGHSWPGGEKPRDAAAAPSREISAVDTIWEFFKGIPAASGAGE